MIMLNKVLNFIKGAKNEFTQLKGNPPSYTRFKEEFENRESLSEGKLCMIPTDANMEDLDDLQSINGILSFR